MCKLVTIFGLYTSRREDVTDFIISVADMGSTGCGNPRQCVGFRSSKEVTICLGLSITSVSEAISFYNGLG